MNNTSEKQLLYLERSRKIVSLLRDMAACEQTPGQSTLKHGSDVWKTFEKVLAGQYQTPKWFNLYKDKILADLIERKKIKQYVLYHDIGKHRCLVIDERGRHFPNHAAISKQTYLEYWSDEQIANLIGWDMVLHTCSSEELNEYLKVWSKEEAVTLLVVALSEIISNAEVHGGFDTTYKIKYKQIERRGNQICKRLYS